MAFYSATLFTDAHANERSALLFSWGFGLINFAQVYTCIPRISWAVSLHSIALPGQRYAQSILLGAALCYSSRSPIWPGLSWAPHSASRYQPTAPRIFLFSLCSYIYTRPSIRRVRVQSRSHIALRPFLCSIAVWHTFIT